jgi:hypothetical protein
MPPVHVPGACFQATIALASPSGQQQQQQQQHAELAFITNAAATAGGGNLVLVHQVLSKVVPVACPGRASRSTLYRYVGQLAAEGDSNSSSYLLTKLHPTEHAGTFKELRRLGALALNAGGGGSQVTACSGALVGALLRKLGVGVAAAAAVAAAIRSATPAAAASAQDEVQGQGGGGGGLLSRSHLLPPPPPPPPPPAAAAAAEDDEDCWSSSAESSSSSDDDDEEQQQEWRRRPELTFPSRLPRMPEELLRQLGRFYGLSLSENARHKLGYIKPGMPVRTQLEAFMEWASAPGVMDRSFEPLTRSTADVTLRVLLQLLGYIRKRYAMALADLQLCMVTAPTYVAEHFAVLISRKIKRTTLIKSMQDIRKVVDYLKARATERQAAASSSAAGAEAAETVQRLVAFDCWMRGPLLRVVRQLGQRSQMVDISGLPSLEQLVQAQAGLTRQAEAAFRQALAAEQARPGALKPHHVLDLQEAVAFNLCFGHSSPLRLSCLLAIKPPRDASTPCTHQGCRLGADCRGNRLELLQLRPDDAAAEGQPLLLRLELPHHKNSHKSDAHSDPIVFDVPGSLAPTLMLWIEHGRPLLLKLMQQAFPGREMQRGHYLERPITLLINHKTAQPFDLQQFHNYFKRILSKAGFSGSQVFYPRALRHIFVSAMSDGELGANCSYAEKVGMAAVMGHSIQQWDNTTYNRTLKRFRAAKGVAAMAQLRHTMLQQQQPQPGQQQQQAAAHAEKEETPAPTQTLGQPSSSQAASSSSSSQQQQEEEEEQQQQQQQQQAQSQSQSQVSAALGVASDSAESGDEDEPPANQLQLLLRSSPVFQAAAAAAWQQQEEELELELEAASPTPPPAAPARARAAPPAANVGSGQVQMLRPAAAAASLASIIAQQRQARHQHLLQLQQARQAAAARQRAGAAAGADGASTGTGQAPHLQAGQPRVPGAAAAQEVIEIDLD